LKLEKKRSLKCSLFLVNCFLYWFNFSTFTYYQNSGFLLFEIRFAWWSFEVFFPKKNLFYVTGFDFFLFYVLWSILRIKFTNLKINRNPV
jgi:hypothetical protein